MYKNKEEIAEKVNGIADELKTKVERAEELQRSALVDRGRIEELKNLYNMYVMAEKEAVEEKDEG